jgi:hypothetical protein
MIKISVISKLIYGFNTIPFKIPEKPFVDKLILKLAWKA